MSPLQSIVENHPERTDIPALDLRDRSNLIIHTILLALVWALPPGDLGCVLGVPVFVLMIPALLIFGTTFQEIAFLNRLRTAGTLEGLACEAGGPKACVDYPVLKGLRAALFILPLSLLFAALSDLGAAYLKLAAVMVLLLLTISYYALAILMAPAGPVRTSFFLLILGSISLFTWFPQAPILLFFLTSFLMRSLAVRHVFGRLEQPDKQVFLEEQTPPRHQSGWSLPTLLLCPVVFLIFGKHDLALGYSAVGILLSCHVAWVANSLRGVPEQIRTKASLVAYVQKQTLHCWFPCLPAVLATQFTVWHTAHELSIPGIVIMLVRPYLSAWLGLLCASRGSAAYAGFIVSGLTIFLSLVFPTIEGYVGATSLADEAQRVFVLACLFTYAVAFENLRVGALSLLAGGRNLDTDFTIPYYTKFCAGSMKIIWVAIQIGVFLVISRVAE